MREDDYQMTDERDEPMNDDIDGVPLSDPLDLDGMPLQDDRDDLDGIPSEYVMGMKGVLLQLGS